MVHFILRKLQLTLKGKGLQQMPSTFPIAQVQQQANVFCKGPESILGFAVSTTTTTAFVV